MNLLLSMLLINNLKINVPYSGICVYDTPVIEELIENEKNKYPKERKSEERKGFVDMVSQYEGKFTYVLGAKANETWDLPTELDCSGFTQYMFHEYFGIDIGSGTFLQSMDLIESGNAHYISYEELQPGDLGFIHKGIDTIIREEDNISLLDNHVGIYMGKDNYGNDLWCHCNALDGTVAINSVDYFSVFVNAID